MSRNINLGVKDETIRKITNSKTFANAPTSIALLLYLHKSTKEGVDLKETVVALDFFGKKEPGTKVRVNVYNLRKKITQFYEEEGKRERIVLSIPKGQYQLEFHEKDQHIFKRRPTSGIKRWFPYAVILILLSLLSISYLPKKKSSIWKPFFTEERSTNLVVGDVFGMMGVLNSGNFGWVRDYSINSLKDYYQKIEKESDLQQTFKPSPYYYVNQMAVEGAARLSSFFSDYNHELEIRFTSRTSLEELKERNTIYIGPIKNKTPFIQFFNEANPYFTLKDSLLFREKHPVLNDSVYRFPYRVFNEELAIVSKIKGPNNTDQLLFFSNHDIGVGACVDFLTASKTLGELAERVGYNNYFTAIFKARGNSRSNLYIQLLDVITFN